MPVKGGGSPGSNRGSGGQGLSLASGAQPMTVTIMVLNDGDTYSAVDGCRVLVLNEGIASKLEAGESLKHLEEGNVVASYSVTSDLTIKPEQREWSFWPQEPGLDIAHPNLFWARRALLQAHPTTTRNELLTVRWDSLMRCYMARWRGMTLGIETDGHIHS